MRKALVLVFGSLVALLLSLSITALLFQPVRADNPDLTGDLNGNVLYIDPGDRVYIDCELCEGTTFNAEFGYVEGMRSIGHYLDGTSFPLATQTPLPVETGQPVPTITQSPTAEPLPTETQPPTSTPIPAATATPLPTVTSTPVVVATPDSGPCVAAWEWAFSEDIDMISPAFYFQERNIAEDGTKTFYPIIALEDNEVWNPDDTVTFCFFVDEVANYKIQMNAFARDNRTDSFYLTYSMGGPDLIDPQIVEWQRRGITETFIASGRRDADITINATSGDVINVSIGSRESNAEFFAIRLVEEGYPVDPDESPVPSGGTPVPPTPEATEASEYPAPNIPTVEAYP